MCRCSCLSNSFLRAVCIDSVQSALGAPQIIIGELQMRLERRITSVPGAAQDDEHNSHNFRPDYLCSWLLRQYVT